MIHNKFRYLLTLVALFALTAGAWAQEETLLTTITPTGDGTYSETTAGAVTVTPAGSFFYSGSSYGWRWDSYGSLTVTANEGYTITRCVFIQQGKNQSVTISKAPFELNFEEWVCLENTSMDGVTSIEVYGTAPAPAIEVTPVAEPAANTKQWTFDMPASDVVLTPIYAAATVYGADGQTEKMAYETLKEAIQNVQDGDVIKLDWDVTFTAQDDPIETSKEGEGVTFTLDLNGYTIDGTALEKPCIVLYNANDQMTITDSKLTGGIKGIPATGAGAIIFDGGRYFLGTEVNAEYLKTNWANYASVGWQLADGKEFVDIENGPDEKGFTLRVDYAAFELTIGAGRFATFYADQNTTLDEGQNIGFYTISNISDDRTEANVTQINSTIIPANTPTLVYNSGNDQQTVKMKVTTDAVNLTVDCVEQFKGTAQDREFTADDMAANDYYALSGGKAFAPVKGAGTLGANQCWLQFDKQQTPGARQLTIVFEGGETTGIHAVDTGKQTIDSYYDLGGRKLQKPTEKGVYILNGKKVVK